MSYYSKSFRNSNKVHDDKRDCVYEITGLRYLREVKRPLLVRGNSLHVWGLVVCAIYWGVFDISWVANLTYGVGTQLCCLIIVTCANLCASFSLCEMISAIPSSGGIVGFGRYAMGPLVGFLCGVIECVCLGTTVVLGAIFWAGYIKDITDTSADLEILWCLLLYIGSSAVIVTGGRFMWNFMLLCAVVCTVLIFFYYLTAMLYGDFRANAFQYNAPTDDPVIGHTPGAPTTDEVWFIGDIESWYVVLPATFWFFGGVECTGVIGEEIFDPTVEVPRGVMSGVFTGYITYILVLFAGVSLPPGTATLHLSSHPYAEGIMMLFPGLSWISAVGIASIGALSTITPWLYAFNRQVFALSRKGFLPSALSHVYNGVPYTALIFCIIIAYAINLIISLSGSPLAQTIIFDIALFATILVYWWICLVYLVIRYKHPHLETKFKSPVGIYGASFGFVAYVVFGVFFILSRGGTVVNSIVVTIVLHVLWVMYYWFVSRNYLVLDADEKHAVVGSLNVRSMLRTEHGLAYLEHHCIKELNVECIYCLKVLTSLLPRYDCPALTLSCLVGNSSAPRALRR